jgi:TatD DNase family protein
MSGWVDSHCHLFACEDPAALLNRAIGAGVEWVVVPGVDVDSSLAARAIAREHPGRVLWSAGLHPHDAARWEQQHAAVRDLAPHASAVGECGLDYYRDLSPREVQRKVFAAHLDLAAELGKPVIVHCRDAFADVFAALEDASLGERAVLHCWTGGPRWTRRFAGLGATFSFAGPITFETGETVRHAAAAAPRDRTLVETDTPYLTPPPDRRATNEPANVVKVGAALAAVWNVDVDEVAALSRRAAARVFGEPAS